MKFTHRQSGFTLIELMVVIAIIGIIAAFAIPGYQKYIKDTRRGAAATCLLEMAQQMEKRYATSLVYNATTTVPNVACTTPIVDYYTIDFKAASLQPTEYVLEATPVASQDDDTCRVLAIDQKTRKYVDTNSTDATKVKTCWK